MFNLQEYLEKIEEDYRDFFFETGKYKNRELGFVACKKYLLSAIENAVKETLEYVEKALAWDWDRNIDENGRDSHWDLGDAQKVIQRLKKSTFKAKQEIDNFIGCDKNNS